MEDFEKAHIIQNLPTLLQFTSCNVKFLSILRRNQIISDIEYQILSNPQDSSYDSSKKLYDILITRSNSFDVLKQALKETNQTGALDIIKKCKSPNENLPFSVNKENIFCKGRNGTKIFLGKYDDREIAVKVLSCPELNPTTELKEIRFLKRLDSHPNIVRYFTSDRRENYIYIALELCVHNLKEWVDTKIERRSISKYDVLRQCTEGLAHVHENKIMHRDLHPGNILISGGGLVKISDFGLACEILDELGIEASPDTVGTEGWMAAEVYSFINPRNVKRVNFSADVFSLGCIFVYVLTGGSHPFGEDLIRKANIVLKRLNLEKVMKKISLPSGDIQFLKDMIAHKPQNRPNAKYILQSNHLWENIFHKKIIKSSYDEGYADCMSSISRGIEISEEVTASLQSIEEEIYNKFPFGSSCDENLIFYEQDKLANELTFICKNEEKCFLEQFDTLDKSSLMKIRAHFQTQLAAITNKYLERNLKNIELYITGRKLETVG